jgi:cyclopropane fatty-acyl-phospholipid synthase-like methyltransferase
MGLFSIGLKILNVHKSVLVDDFSDSSNNNKEIKNMLKKFNVNFFSYNLLSNDIIRLKEKYDIITCFHTIEHLHHSPKKLLTHISKIIKKEGSFILCAPNSNNIKKRIECLFGVYAWSNLNDYFNSNIFRGHVREPSITDLIFFVKYMNLKIVKVYGRNWQGLSSGSRFIRIISIIFDRLLRLFPSLCSDIYIVGKKI